MRTPTPAPLLLVSALLGGLLPAPPGARAAPIEDTAAALLARIRENTGPARRLGIMTDRPLYRPGDAVWMRIWGAPAGLSHAAVRLFDARGREVADAAVPTATGAGVLDLPLELAAGRYTLRASALGLETERPIVVERTTPPALRMVLRYARATHRPGDRVVAAVAVRRADDTPLAGRPVQATVRAGDGPPIELSGRTDDRGRVTLRFDLPQRAMDDARLNLRFEDGGATSALTRPIPLAPAQPAVALFPEGGDLVAGLPGRVYVAATDAAGRPVSFAGRVVDDAGVEVARVRSRIHGRARFELTPTADQGYALELDGGRYALPAPRRGGCRMRAVDDFAGARPTIGLDLGCTRDAALMVIASRDDAVLDAREVYVRAGGEARVELKADRRRGAVRVTLVDAGGTPLAERVVFRNRDRTLRVTVTPDRAKAAPGEAVRLTVRAADPDGRPVDADLALAVVDDGVLAFADDRSPDLAAQMLLMPVVRGYLEEAGRYLAPGEAAGRAMDLLMGTAGYRRFEWLWPSMPDPDRDGIPSLYDTCPGEPEVYDGVADDDGCPDGRSPEAERETAPEAAPAPPPGEVPEPRGEVEIDGPLRPGARPVRRRPLRTDPGPGSTPGDGRVIVTHQRMQVVERIYFRAERDEVLPQSLVILDEIARVMRAHPYIRRVEVAGHTDSVGTRHHNQRLSQQRAEAVRRLLIERGVEPARLVARGYGEDRPISPEHSDAARSRNRRVEFQILDRAHRGPEAVYRRFPPPPPPTAARDDFRETIAWVSRLTLKDGQGAVEVRLSDALTGFRATVQGVGGGAIGRGEAVVVARRPVAVEADAPPSLLRGDRLMAPLTVSNHTAKPVRPRLVWRTVPAGLAEGDRTLDPLAPGERRTIRIPLEAQKAAPHLLELSLTAGPWRDAVQRQVRVLPRGFPHRLDRAGILDPGAPTAVRLPIPAAAEGAEAALILTRSGVATLLGAVQAMVRHPTGCFEQTTAIHWPNVMALRLFEASGQPVPPEVIEQTRAYVEAGAARLVGFATAAGGFSKYGRPPARPAITALGVVQLIDSGVDPGVIRAAVHWLDGHRKARRDGARGEAAAAWIDWALALGGRPLDPERVAAPAEDDPYVLAVRILALKAAGEVARAGALADALARRQAPSGAWVGARSSITYSRGLGLTIEATGLAIRALAALDRDPEARDRGIGWLFAHRRGGAWISTQATAQALAAILTRPLRAGDPDAGHIEVRLGDARVERLAVAELEAGVRTLDLGPWLGAGETLTLTQTAGAGAQWSVTGRWRAETVPPAEDPALALTTALDRPTLKPGEAATLTVTVEARREAPDPLVRVGLPAGLEPDREQLRAWTERGRVALAEVRPGEVVLYLEDMAPGAAMTLPLTVTARRPGRSVGPASSAYPYYTPDAAWAPPLAVQVE